VSLPGRNFIVQTPDCPEPSQLEIPYVERKKYDPREIEAATRERLLKVPFVPFDAREIESSGKRITSRDGEISKDHMGILEDIIERPFATLIEREKKLRIPPESLAKRMSELLGMRLIRPLEDCSTGKKPFKTTFITEEAARLLGKDYGKCIPPGKGGVNHRWVQHCLKQALENSVIEFQSGDLVQYCNGLKMVWEIEMNPKEPHVLEQIQRDLANFDRITMVAKSQADLKVLVNSVKKHFGSDERISFTTVGEVLKNGTAARLLAGRA